MPTREWLEKYESVKEILACKTDLEAYFTKRKIGKMAVDILDIGNVHFPTGRVFACDPLVELEDALPYIQTAPAGTYPVKICVVPSEKYGDRYACVKVEISGRKPVRYDLAMNGKEELTDDLKEGEYYGFGVDAGMGCIADVRAQEEFRKYWQKRLHENESIDPYNDLFCDILEKSFLKNLKYQRDGGDWANWTVPGTDCDIPIFASGWGDGAYPCYFGYDGDGSLCGLYILFINIEREYED